MVRASLVLTIVASVLGPLTAASACVLHPTAPVFTPQSAEIVSITAARLGLRLKFLARNPNCYTLTAQSISARVSLAGLDMGTTRVPDGVSLPSDRDTPISVDLQVPWNNLPGLVAAVALNPEVPYRINGNV